ncbi:MAG: hypothetical protein CFH10_01728 [Alphaproteobacteria bacterium MarineAlpha4_Bin2]|nr:MAG: hypothetical protein CFH10_01728 [Alphaproteobacteria bacterium MarineAlpha4_Bin2]
MSNQPPPRLAPLSEAEWTDEMREMFAPTIKTFGRVFNIFATLGRHPKLLKRWMVFANHCLLKSSLPPRERELVILRAGWLCKSDYEWAQHNRIGLEAGLSVDEIERVKNGAAAMEWNEAEKVLLAAVDQLLETKTLDDAGWVALGEHFNEQQVLDIIFTAGNYATLAMALNACRVEVDDGV